MAKKKAARNEKKSIEVTIIEPTDKFVDFIGKSSGVFFASEDDFREGHTVLKPDTYSLAKWLSQNRPELKVEIDKCDNTIDLNSEEIWIPLAILASDIALPLFLSAVYDYLKWRVRGALSEEVPTVHIRVISKNKDNYKEFKYNGPVDGLSKLKKIDVNELMND